MVTPNSTQNILALSGSNELAVANEDVAYSRSFKLPRNRAMGVEYQFSSDANVGVSVELEQSNYEPTAEGQPDANFVVPDNISPINPQVNDKVVHYAPVYAMVTTWARFKFTGLSGNDSTTKLTKLKLNTSENA